MKRYEPSNRMLHNDSGDYVKYADVIEEMRELRIQKNLAESRADIANDRIRQLEKLAYIGDHHFEENTYKYRLDELERERDAYNRAKGGSVTNERIYRAYVDERTRADHAEARVKALEAIAAVLAKPKPCDGCIHIVGSPEVCSCCSRLIQPDLYTPREGDK